MDKKLVLYICNDFDDLWLSSDNFFRTLREYNIDVEALTPGNNAKRNRFLNTPHVNIIFCLPDYYVDGLTFHMIYGTTNKLVGLLRTYDEGPLERDEGYSLLSYVLAVERSYVDENTYNMPDPVAVTENVVDNRLIAAILTAGYYASTGPYNSYGDSSAMVSKYRAVLKCLEEAKDDERKTES